MTITIHFIEYLIDFIMFKFIPYVFLIPLIVLDAVSKYLIITSSTISTIYNPLFSHFL